MTTKTRDEHSAAASRSTYDTGTEKLPILAAQACLAFGFCAAAVAVFAPPPHWPTWLGIGLLISAPLTWLVMRERAAEADEEPRPRLLVPAARPILIAVMILAAIAALSRTREFVYKERSDFAPAVLGVISIGCGIYSITSLDRRRIAQEDAWRASRRTARVPDKVDAERRDLEERWSATEARSARPAIRLRVESRPETGIERFLERALVVYLGIAVLFALALGPLAIVVYTTIAHGWLAILNLLESRRFDGPRLPTANSELRAAKVKIRKARGFRAASPPVSLKRMRIAFYALAILVVAFGFAQVVLGTRVTEGDSQLLWPLPACLAFGALWQWPAESAQARAERDWLAGQAGDDASRP